MKHFFTEKQKIDTIWPLAILAITAIFNYFLYFHFGMKEMDFFYNSILSVTLICAVLLSFRMKTDLNEVEITYSVFPLHFKKQRILWSSVENAAVRTYRPLREYGGWGIRNGFSGKAYTVSGNQGLQLTLKGGKKVLIGTHKTDELQVFINKLGYK